jgi:hypothetical protein
VRENSGKEIECINSLTGKWDDFVSCSGGTFKETLKVEKIGQPIADAFYKDTLKAIDIKRYDYKDPWGKFMQGLDVDCSIELLDKDSQPFWLNISEKFRQCECGDMCLELWSNFEKRTLGWATDVNRADYYVYVTPRYIFEVCANDKFRHVIDVMKEYITRDFITKTFEDDMYYLQPITVQGHKLTLIKSWTANAYYGICVCIPWTTLFNDFLLDINMYDRKGQKLQINEVYER